MNETRSVLIGIRNALACRVRGSGTGRPRAVARGSRALALAVIAAAGCLAAPSGHARDWPTLEVARVNGNEGATAQVVVSLSHAPSDSARVDYRVATGWMVGSTAEDADVGAVKLEGETDPSLTGTLRFDTDDWSKTLSIGLLDDSMDEENETVSIVFSRPWGVRIGRRPVTAVTILDNDERPSISVSSPSPDVAAAEGEELQFAIELSEPSGRDVFIHVEAVPSFLSDTNPVFLASPNDFDEPAGRIRFDPGVQRKVVSVGMNTDDEWEFDETFRVRFQRPRNATIADAGSHGRKTFIAKIIETPPRDAAYPGRLTATAQAPGRVELVWELPEPGPGERPQPKYRAMPEYYQIERSSDDRATWEPVADRTETAPYYIDVTARPGTTYVYRVRSVRDAAPVVESRWRSSNEVTTSGFVEEDGGTIGFGGMVSSLDTLMTRKRYTILLDGGTEHRVHVDGVAPYYLTTLTGPNGVSTIMRSHEMRFTPPGSGAQRYTVTVERVEGDSENSVVDQTFDYGCGFQTNSCHDSGGTAETGDNNAQTGFNVAGAVTGPFFLLIVPIEDEPHGQQLAEDTHPLLLHDRDDTDYFTLRPQRGHAYAVRLRGREGSDTHYGTAYTPRFSRVERPSGEYHISHSFDQPGQGQHHVVLNYQEAVGGSPTQKVEQQGFLLDLRHKSGSEREEWRVWVKATGRRDGIGWAERIGSYTLEYRRVASRVRGSGPIRAGLKNVPDAHDGTEPFQAEVWFSEPVETSDEHMAQRFVRVRGGAVTRVTRQVGHDDSWQVEVQPEDDGDVTVSVEGAGTCANGAVCSDDGRPVSGAASASVRGPGSGPAVQGLTAKWLHPPSEHNGQSVVMLQVLFTAPVETSHEGFEAHGVSAVNGTVERVRPRGEPARRDLWDLYVRPSAGKDLTVRIGNDVACGETGALCTAEGTRLAEPLSIVVPGPPKVRVANARVREAPGATLDFKLSLSRASQRPIQVAYRTRDRTAKAGSDYERAMGAVRFAPGETAKTVSVKVLDDAIDEGEETMRLALWQTRGKKIRRVNGTGTIVNSDPLQKMWLARFGRTVADQVVEAVSDRLARAPTGAQVTLAGRSVDLTRVSEEEGVAQAITGLARALGASGAPEPDEGAGGWAQPQPRARDYRASGGASTRSVSGRELLLGSTFHLSHAGDGGGPGYAAWGRVTTGGFDGEDVSGAVTTRIDGDVTTGILGADAAWERWLAGVALSVSEGEGTFGQSGGLDDGNRGTVESSLTSVQPYVRVEMSERLSAWGLLGFGSGDMTITEAASGPRVETVTRTDIGMRLGALGARGALLEADESGGIDLALEADAFLVQMDWEKVSSEKDTQADASRLRLVLEGSRAFALGEGSTLTPGLELGLRHDGGDAETGTGVEVGGRIAYADAGSGLSIEASARTLIAHEVSGYEEWGASGSVRLDPGASGRGLSFSLAPVWGTPSSGVERLWSARDAAGLASGGEFEAERRLEGEVGYGFGAFGERGVVTPYAGLGLAEAGDRTWRAGARWSLAPHLAMSLDGTRREPANDDAPEHGAQFRFTLRW